MKISRPRVWRVSCTSITFADLVTQMHATRHVYYCIWRKGNRNFQAVKLFHYGFTKSRLGVCRDAARVYCCLIVRFLYLTDRSDIRYRNVVCRKSDTHIQFLLPRSFTLAILSARDFPILASEFAYSINNKFRKRFKKGPET